MKKLLIGLVSVVSAFGVSAAAMAQEYTPSPVAQAVVSGITSIQADIQHTIGPSLIAYAVVVVVLTVAVAYLFKLRRT